MATPPTFAVGQVLTSAVMNQAGLWKVASKTFTSTSSAQQIDDCFTTDYNNYRIIFAGVGSTTNALWITGRLVDGTSPISTSIYFHSFSYSGTAATTTGFQGSQAQWLVGLIGDTVSQFSWDLFNPKTANKTTGVSTYMVSSTTDYLTGNNGQLVNNTTQYEGIWLQPASGTWAGTITVYGYRD